MDDDDRTADGLGTWDHVVVGAGAAGCVLASRLSEDPSVTVLLLEAGGAGRSLATAVPALIQKQSSDLNWLHPVEPDASRGGVAEPYSAGRGLGGSTLVNAMMWVRGTPRDYDDWGLPGWDHASLLPCFRRSERFEDGADAVRGGAGPQRVARTRVDHPMTRRFLAAAQQDGFAPLADLNGPVQEGVSLSQVAQRRGLRHSAADAYLSRAVRRRPNLTVLTGCRVDRVLLDGRRAVGVALRRDGVPTRVRARREVLLCAGALGSPKLLLLSGIGPAEDLRSVGVDVVADLPGVGRDLQEHPATGLVLEVTERTLNQDLTPLRLARHALDFAVRGRGAVTSTANHAVAFDGTPETGPEAELIFVAFGLEDAGGDGDASAGRLARATARSGGREEGRRRAATAPLVTVTAALLQPRGRGSLSLRSADPDEPLRICQQLLGDEADVAGLTRAARRARSIAAQPALAATVVREVTPGPAVQTDEQWAEHLRGHTSRLFHPTSTCRMGTDGGAVLDAELRVRGVQGLRVVDASAFPRIPRGNTWAPTTALAERASDLVRAHPTGG